MKNVVLVKGRCPICSGKIDVKWAGENPTLGTVCQNCFNKRDQVFGPENIEIVVARQVVFVPLFDKYEYHFDWYGTKVMVNGQVGEVQQAFLGSCMVKFLDGPEWGESINSLGYWQLKEIYKVLGGEMEPPPLHFKAHTPKKVRLLGKPIIPVKVDMDDAGNIDSIQVGRHSIGAGLMGGPAELPMLPMLHAFCNLFVRYKFGLAPNFAAEGGFIGRDFEVRNAGGFIGGCGLLVTMYHQSDLLRYVHDETAFRALANTRALIGLTLDREKSRAGVGKDANVQEVLSVWVNLMETLLKYNWTKRKSKTIKDVYENYCIMQNILANVLEPEELTAALAYAKKGEIVHAGSSF